MNDFWTMDRGSEGNTGYRGPCNGKKEESTGEKLGESDSSESLYKSPEKEGKDPRVCVNMCVCTPAGKLRCHKDSNSPHINL